MKVYQYRDLTTAELRKNGIYPPDYNYMAKRDGLYSFAKEQSDGKIARMMYWVSCRETFNSRWLGNQAENMLLFTCRSNEVIPIWGCLIAAEQKLGLTDRTTIAMLDVDEPRAIVVEPCLWWKRNGLRKQFFSSLLRVARFFEGDLYKTIFNEKVEANYFTSTRQATQRFLDGYTITSGNLSFSGEIGWYERFKGGINVNHMILDSATK